MVKIDSSGYGYITIDGVTYQHDIFILPSGEVKNREYGHTFTKDQVKYIVKEKPEVVIVGKGTAGLASLSQDARTLLEENHIEIIEGDTQSIVSKFNDLSSRRRVAAIIHITC